LIFSYELYNTFPISLNISSSKEEKTNSAHTFQRLSTINSLKSRSSVLSLFVCSRL